ncbi:3-hydroxyacyl-CoA dehydrogenase [Parendozoicomonas haliclonae]|uniref:3-alpha-(Or 20-beta)-hydroxysteroid dehydrogenase n=1 Tax=Parendozoicomonas haliclonae TaxID=1960125 RepID=A0A1X7AIK6_9GAMM|nr:3-hydroxyacyl-CoA dehydrogenase [Parendozoicomonas haliclonae]SMA43916.1 3-alpha-(or 20-beta)-hydroxysteroid dehydrogenase [Parendozoicomonas haliclonae]
MDLQNKVAVVTGGASGLGQAAVRALVAKGAKAVIFDLNAEAGAAMVAELGSDKVFAAQVNVTDEASVQSGLDQAMEAFGDLHIIVNCAGIGPPAKVIDREGQPLPLDSFKKIVDINLNGTFNVLRLAAAKMQHNQPVNDDQGRGVIINVASVAAFDGQIGQPAYAASKAGIVGMTLPIARELARYGIRVNTIAPGLFMTPLAASLPEAAIESLGKSVEYPKRLGNPEEFAHLVVCMAENDYFNGETVRLDGSIRMAAR